MTGQLRDAKHTAAALAVSETELHRRCRAGEWPCVQLSALTRRWTDEQIAEIVARHTQPARTASSPAGSVTPMRTRQARGPQRRTA
jgi:hypothetical protein